MVDTSATFERRPPRRPGAGWACIASPIPAASCVLRQVLPWLVAGALVFLSAGLAWGLFFAPADWQQGDAVRIMYVHVPAAWLAPSGYLALAFCSLLSSCGGIRSPIWRRPRSGRWGPASPPLSRHRSLWGRPMWGAWWVWDARLTSVLVLFFLYLGHVALVRAFDDPGAATRGGASWR